MSEEVISDTEDPLSILSASPFNKFILTCTLEEYATSRGMSPSDLTNWSMAGFSEPHVWDYMEAIKNLELIRAQGMFEAIVDVEFGVEGPCVFARGIAVRKIKNA